MAPLMSNVMQQANMAAGGMNPNIISTCKSILSVMNQANISYPLLFFYPIEANIQGANMNVMTNVIGNQPNSMGNVMQNTLVNMQQGNLPAGSMNAASMAMGNEFTSFIVAFSLSIITIWVDV